MTVNKSSGVSEPQFAHPWSGINAIPGRVWGGMHGVLASVLKWSLLAEGPCESLGRSRRIPARTARERSGPG